MRLPDFVIVGAMRSGTTTLVTELRKVPGVGLPAGKEMHFFDDHYERGLGWYSDLFASLEAAVVGEATPNYMHDRKARERLLADLPEAHFIAILRNPIDRAWSHYWFNVSRGKEPLTFSKAVEAEDERLRASPSERRTFSYLDRGRYAEQLAPILEGAGRERVQVLYFEHFLDQPSEVIGRMLERIKPGLGGSVPIVDQPAQVNRYVEFRSLKLRSIAKRINHPMLRRVAGRVATKTNAEYPEMDGGVRRALAARLGDTVQELSELGLSGHGWADWPDG